MAPIKTNKHDGTYSISAKFANTILAAILGGLLAVVTYMVNWNRDDAAFKSRFASELASTERLLDQRIIAVDRRLSEHINVNAQKISHNEDRLDRISR